MIKRFSATGAADASPSRQARLEQQKQQTEGIRQAVDSALDAEDNTPLIRLVFDAQHLAGAGSGLGPGGGPSNGAAANGGPHPQEEDEEEEGSPGSSGSEEEEGGGGRRRRGGARARDVAELILDRLRDVTLEQEAELEEVCGANADDIALSLQELGVMEEDAEELRAQIEDIVGQLEEGGGLFLEGLTALQAVEGQQRALSAFGQAVTKAIRLMDTTMAAGKLLEQNELYKAFRLMQSVQEQLEAGPAAAASTGGLAAPAVPPPGAPSRGPQGLGTLEPFLVARLGELRQALEARCEADFKAWLVSVKEETLNVGLGALHRAALEHLAEAALLQERRRLQEALAGPAMPGALARDVLTAGRVRPGGAMAAVRALLDPSTNPAICQLLDASVGVKSEGPLLAGGGLERIDMTLLHRCVQVRGCLGQLPAFLGYYQEQRVLQHRGAVKPVGEALVGQRTLDGPPGAAVLRKFLALFAGHFVIEHAVRRSSEALREFGQDCWQEGAALLERVLRKAFQDQSTAGSMLLVKDLVLLLRLALGACSYSLGKLDSLLRDSRERHHLLACGELEVELAKLPEEAERDQVETAAEARELSLLGLVLGRDEAGSVPAAPFQAPFSGRVPAILRLARGFIERTVAYVTALGPAIDVLKVAREHRNKMLVEVLVRRLQDQVALFDAGAPNAIERSSQLVADAWCLGHALPALDQHTLLCARGSGDEKLRARSPRRGPDGKLRRSHKQRVNPQAAGIAPLVPAFQGLTAAAEGLAAGVLTGQARGILLQAKALQWLPDVPPRTAAGPTTYTAELLAYLKGALEAAWALLPRPCQLSVTRSVFAALGGAFMDLLLEEQIPAFNMYAIFRLNDDVTRLENFAANELGLPQLAEALAEPAEFCRLLVGNRLEEVLDPAQRGAKYGALALPRLARILAKYREVGDSAAYHGQHTLVRSRQPESFLKRKTADKVSKALLGAK